MTEYAKYVNFMSSTAFMIIYYYNGVQMHNHYDDIFIVSDISDKAHIDALIKLKVNIDIDAILDDNPELDISQITYKIFKNKYYLNNEFIQEYKI